MEEIKDYETYTNSMKKGLYDKCWWIDKVLPQVDTVIDIGCANGDLRDMIESIAPGRFTYIGIEENHHFYEELDNCHIQYAERLAHIPNNWVNWSNTIIVMNSVVHEIYNYRGSFEFLEMLNYCKKLGVKHIAIRDMYYNIDIHNLDRASTESFLYNLCRTHYTYAFCKNKLSEEYFKTHKNNFKNMIEFFLKYKYIENWDRESKEEYFWPWIEDIYEWLDLNDGMNCEYVDFFTILPQIRTIENDFNVHWHKSVKTHAKMLLTNKEK